ncbi:C6 transcription factor [Penicillium hispanicum]|uniref:C6 transcription factor n=1 Tax=Penicillium hispanicum TaxID=1080232 RepID=UPI0025416E20|nr:C6 transcription factor [Penicillium hispanicum]KAJ5569962.1 C6 transcription factor [Penicillium hispanicum]
MSTSPASHLDNGSMSPSAGPTRKRSRQACLPCRRRKRKCDGKLPCNLCKGYEYDCQYDSHSQLTPLKRLAPSHGSESQPGGKPARISPAQRTSRRIPDSSMLPGIIEPSKPRYVGRSSVVAFPLYVGLEVQATKLPRLHSFAYHTGIRKEPSCAVTHKLAERISWNTTRSLIEFYTAVIHRVFGFLDMDIVYTLCEKHWHGQPQDMVFEAMICGILGLASLFSDTLDEETETWMILHAKEVLEDPGISRFPSLEMIAAWILRTIYVRCTGRPHVTWMCSCTLMHLVEATGLHHTPEFMMQATGNVTPNAEVSDIVNRTAQVANCLHILIGFEYGRSIMTFTHQALEPVPPAARKADLTPQLCALVAAVPTNQGMEDSILMTQQLTSALEKVTEMHVDHDFLVLLRADLALGIYRRLRIMDSGHQHGPNDRVVAAGILALPAARSLACQNQPWWNIVGTVFQFACALLVMDTPTSCEKLAETIDTLEFIVDRLGTHLAKEALSTARHLVRASLDKKRKGVEILDKIVRAASPGISGGTDNQLSQDMNQLSPSLAADLPNDLDHFWAMDFQMPL